MKTSTNDMLGISTKLVAIFVRPSRVFTQSSELWAHLTKKSILSPIVFSQSTNIWA